MNFTSDNSDEKTNKISYYVKRIFSLEEYYNMNNKDEDFKVIYKNIVDLLVEEATIKL